MPKGVIQEEPRMRKTETLIMLCSDSWLC